MSKKPLFSLVIPFVLFSAAGAQAGTVIEPQMLAMISTHGAKPLICDGATCSAEFSAFCMEPHRPGPAHASDYRLTKAGPIKISVVGKDGTRRSVDISKARFNSERGYSAVRVSLPKELLAKLGGEKFTVSVGKHVVLMPVRTKDHVLPHSDAEIKAAMGPNRLVGNELVDQGGERAEGARLISYLLNGLPAYQETTTAQDKGLWSATAAAPKQTLANGTKFAKAAYQLCLKNKAAGKTTSLRDCLQHKHDRAMWQLNQIYWKSVGPGS